MDLTTRELDGLVTWTLIRAAHRAQRELTQVFADHGLSPVQFGVLSHLATGEAFTQARLAREVLVRPQSLSGVIDGLVARGLVARGEDRGKGRRNPLVLTPAGHDLLEVVWPRLQDANRPDHLGLAPAEAAALNEVLLRLLHPPRDGDDGGDGGGSGDGG